MSKFTNSPLATYKRISPNRNSPRTEDKITKIIVHHMAGVGSVESFGEIVANPARQMSANYAIGNDGRIGLYCEEKGGILRLKHYRITMRLPSKEICPFCSRSRISMA